MPVLGPAFYERPVERVARDLLGTLLVHDGPEGRTAVRIMETEAYGGGDDPASHAYRRPTARNAVMFGPAGRLYVYVSYGMHVCMNVVTGGEGEASAVLIRAGEPIEGIPLMQARRGTARLADLCSGPGKLCQALGITLAMYGMPLDGAVRIVDDGTGPDAIAVSGRIGVSRGTELPLRFYIEGSPWVSKGRPAAGSEVVIPAQSGSRASVAL